MKKSLLISPHCDDAPFSIGSFIPQLGEVIIVSPFDGIPEDEKGKRKHTILNQEHKEACENLGAEIISGYFLDDVYHETRDLSQLVLWFKNILDAHKDYEVYLCLGIHHPDHLIVRDIFIKHFRIDYFYAELPYRIRYPYLYENLKLLLLNNYTVQTMPSSELKETSCRKYVSQIDEQVMADILVEEQIWSIK